MQEDFKENLLADLEKSERMSGSKRCAGCKSLRRKCPLDCPLAPYFPSTNPQRFAYVHRVFGASNVARKLQDLPEDLRAEAADCMTFEAISRVRDPVYGCVAIISQLQQQIVRVQYELSKTKCEVAFCEAQQQPQQQEQQEPVIAGEQEGATSWLSTASQEELFALDQLLQADQNPTLNIDQ